MLSLILSESNDNNVIKITGAMNDK